MTTTKPKVKKITPELRRTHIEMMARQIWHTLETAQEHCDWQQHRIAWLTVSSVWVPLLNVIHFRQTLAKKPNDPRSTRIVESIAATRTLSPDALTRMREVDQMIVMDQSSIENIELAIRCCKEVLELTESHSQKKKRRKEVEANKKATDTGRMQRMVTAATGLLTFGLSSNS
ncbi:hypothetical protein [Rhodopirellula sp. MGV]|uniref:hypothetical protein n=1 Tax=Rhodopirellula sp. MGV TaxID=2023130 RepID=UPI00117B8116|nr:hypothetical protein [Rhodopirellula sp. MGV]